MIADRPQTARVTRQIADFERQLGGPALRLAAHAALPVVLTPELLHLIRINFLQDADARVPFAAEGRLLLSSLCREIGGDLFEIDSEVRTSLLAVLERDYGERRIREVAALLLQYTQEASPWADRPQLERAQQLTALNFLEPLRAQEWLDAAETGSTGTALDRQWFVAMRQEMFRGQEQVAAVVSKPADPGTLYDALTGLDFKAQRSMVRVTPATTGASLELFLVYGPEGHGQRWVLDLILRELPPAELLVLPITISRIWQGVASLLGLLTGRETDMGYGAAISYLSTRLASHDVVLAFGGINERFGGDVVAQFWKFWNELVTGLRKSSIGREGAELRVFLLGTWEGPGIPDALTRRPLTILPRLEAFNKDTFVQWLTEYRSVLPPELTSDVEAMADRILAGSNGGVPDSALRYIAESCLVPWTEIESRARAETRWQPVMPGSEIPGEALRLADEYNGTRAQMPSGPDRTRAMEAIVAKMRRLKLTPGELAGLVGSPSAGLRLVAVVALQQVPEQQHLRWLAERLRDEKPFVGYHAAVALERAAERLEESQLDAVEEAIGVARSGLGNDLGLTDRAQALDRVQIVVDDRRAAIAESAEKRPARKRASRPAAYQAATTPWKLWPPGKVLTVRFLDGDPFVQDLVKRIAPQWTENANIAFEFLPAGSSGSADIRVSFAEPVTYAYVGTDASAIPTSEATVNLAGLTSTVPDEDASRMILQSFGHALGLVHEHQNPTADIRWDVDAIRHDLGGPPSRWTEADIRANILTRYRFPSPPEYRDFDPDSVMLFRFPKAWTRLAVDVGGASTLSASDRAFIRTLYPPDPSSRSFDAVDESAAPAASGSSA